ncbi:VOC family protein [Alteromonadaceae bacterium M269]|nr:VOC family protein [Alteromonadaceae bacterium M269]
MNLNQVTMPVYDLPTAVTFYQELGFKLIVDSPAYARFKCPEGNSSFSLSLHPNVKNYSTIYFEHQDLDNWVATLIEKGIAFDQLPQDQTYLWREAILYDPSGNKLILYWAGENRLNPPWRVN